MPVRQEGFWWSIPGIGTTVFPWNIGVLGLDSGAHLWLYVTDRKTQPNKKEGTTMNRQISEKELDTKLEALAQEFGFETLKARSSDDLDFHEVSVWGLREMLAAAYQAGLKDAHAGVSAVAETVGVFQARICTLDGWQTVGTAPTKREALALAEAACTKAGLDPEYCTSARQIA